jgi:hypothetical protein
MKLFTVHYTLFTILKLRDALLPKLMSGEVRVKRRDFEFIKKEKNYGKN